MNTTHLQKKKMDISPKCILSEATQTQKCKCYMLSLIYIFELQIPVVSLQQEVTTETRKM